MMKKWFWVAACALLLSGCRQYVPPAGSVAQEETEKMELYSPGESAAIGDGELGSASEAEPAISSRSDAEAGGRVGVRERVKVKGVYVSAYAAGDAGLMDGILQKIGETEINAVVIDVKNDEGRVTYDMDTPMVKETGASIRYMRDLPGLIARLKEQGIYVIARVVAFRDPYLAEAKPEWSLKTADGEIYRDSQNLAWIDPYRTEVWDYLTEIGTAAAEAGFDEIQFDYIRFSAGEGMEQVVIPDDEAKGRSRTDIITEFTQYAYEKLKKTGAFVSADVFGTVIESRDDAALIGQVYSDMADQLDYICPMIYPSHYGDGNFSLDHPDLHPYETVAAALEGSVRVLGGEAGAAGATPSEAGATGSAPPGANAAGTPSSGTGAAKVPASEVRQAIVRPWLQDFTATYLKHHQEYGPEQLRQQIQAVYDAGYEEWILWDAKCTYTWDGLLPAGQ